GHGGTTGAHGIPTIRSSPPTPGDRIYGRAYLQQWIVGRLDAVDQVERVEGQGALGRVVVGHLAGDRQDAELDDLPGAGPDRGRAVHLVGVARELHYDAELRRLAGQPRAQLIDQEVGRLPGRLLGAQESRAGLRAELVAAEAGPALGVGEFERIDA